MVKVNGANGNGDRFQGDIQNPGWLIHYVGNVSRLQVPNRQTPSENGSNVYNYIMYSPHLQNFGLEDV